MRILDLGNERASHQVLALGFFAQCMEELLNDHTYDSYKVPALNTHTRVMELSRITRQLAGTSFLSSTLPTFLEELDLSVKSDPVLRPSAKRRISERIAHVALVKDKPEQCLSAATSLRIEFETYADDLRAAVERTILAENVQKEKIRALSEVLAVELTLEGFSPRFVYFVVRRLYRRLSERRRRGNPELLIRWFLKRFSVEEPERKYAVIFKGSPAYARFENRTTQFRFEVKTEPPSDLIATREATEWLPVMPTGARYLVFSDLSARDLVSAKTISELLLGHFNATVDFVLHDQDVSFSPDAVVAFPDKRASLLKPAPDPMKLGVELPHEHEGLLERVAEVLVGRHLTPESSEQVRNALRYHSAALHANYPANQLLDLWAALEGLLINPRSAESKIKQVLQGLMPCLLLTYVDDLFLDLQRDIESDPIATRFFAELQVEGDPHQRAAAYCVCSDLDAARSALPPQIAQSNPLLLNRTKVLRDKFLTPKTTIATLLGHRRKVTWHVHRIYTLRNSIVHTASSLPYLPTLVQHLHTYVDAVLNSITHVAVAARRSYSLEEILKHLDALAMDRMRAQDGNDEVCSLKTYAVQLVGFPNPLTKFVYPPS